MARFIIAVTFVLCVGCMPSGMDTTPPANVAGTNAIRKKIGIRQIHKKWKFYIREFNCEKWQSSNRLVKNVQYSEGAEHASILWEQDYYYGAGWLRDPDGEKVPEQVVVSYDYGQSRFFVTYLGENAQARSILDGIVLYDQKPGDVVSEMGHSGASNTETLRIADKLIKLIGQNRLNLALPKSEQ